MDVSKILFSVVVILASTIVSFSQVKLNPSNYEGKTFWLKHNLIFIEKCQTLILKDTINSIFNCVQISEDEESPFESQIEDLKSQGVNVIDLRKSGNVLESYEADVFLKRGTKIEIKKLNFVNNTLKITFLDNEGNSYEVLINRSFRKSFDFAFSRTKFDETLDYQYFKCKTKKEFVKYLSFPRELKKLKGNQEDWIYSYSDILMPICGFNDLNVTFKGNKVIEISGTI